MRFWRRKSKPLAGERVNYVVMDETITMLDPDVSQFTAMLMKLSRRAEVFFFRDDPEDWGFGWDESALSEEAKRAHDHFLDQTTTSTVEWLEDELLPRLSA